MGKRAWAGAFAGAILLALPVASNAADAAPPRIVHTPVREAPANKTLTLQAVIEDESGVFEPTLYYRSAGTRKFSSASMTKTSGSAYVVTIPAAVMATDLDYFLEAYDVHGNGPARFASSEAPQRVRALGPPNPEAVATSAAVSPAEPTHRLRTFGYATAGVGAAGLIAGGIFGLSARSREKDALKDGSAMGARNKYNDARSAATTANVLFIAGGALAAVGVVLAILPSLQGSGAKSSTAADKSRTARLELCPSGGTLALSF